MPTSLEGLYQQKLALILDAEEQALEAYPEMVGMVGDGRLRQAFETHLRETQRQAEDVRRLVGATSAAGRGGGMRCASMEALIAEAREMAAGIDDADTRDAYLVAAAQAMEHHEIAAYGTARAWARQIGRADDADVLDRILDEEKRTDALLTDLAESRVNEDAAQGA